MTAHVYVYCTYYVDHIATRGHEAAAATGLPNI